MVSQESGEDFMGKKAQAMYEDLGRQLGVLDWRAEEWFIHKEHLEGKMKREDLYLMHQALASEALELMKKKNQDYATGNDPFRNFRTFGELGILVRMSDKIARLRTFLERGEFSVTDESCRDSILDLINYSVLLNGMLVEHMPEVKLQP
jgi:hypothetical protein